MKRNWILLVLLLLGGAAFLLQGCRKDDKEQPAVQDPTAGPLTLHDNVLVVDSTKHRLDQSKALLAVGTYRFTSNGVALGASVGTVIVGAQGRGFLRKVTAVTTLGNVTTLQTQAAYLDDVFSGGTLTLRSSSDSLHQRTTAGGPFSYSFGSKTIYQNGPLNLSMRSGNVSINPSWEIKVGFSPQKTVYAKVTTDNASLDGNFVFAATATGAANFARTDTLTHYYKDVFRVVPVGLVPVPIWIRMNFDVLLQSSASVDGTFSRVATFDTHSTFNVGAEYANGQWQGSHTFTPTYTFTLGPTTGIVNGNIKVAVVPSINFKLYNALGPYASVGALNELKAGLALPSGDWDFAANSWLRGTVGATGSVLGRQLPDYYASWETNKFNLYNAPDHLTRIAGDNQTGPGSRALPTPVKVRVFDSRGNAAPLVPVYFIPATAGSGIASPDKVMTDADGYAQTTWTLGPATTPAQFQYLNALVKKADGTSMPNSPVDFAALATDYCDGLQTLQIDSIKVASRTPAPNRDTTNILDVRLYTKGGKPPFTVNVIGRPSSNLLSISNILNASCEIMRGGFANNMLVTYYQHPNLDFIVTDAYGVVTRSSIRLNYR